MIKSKYNWDITQPNTFISESSSDQFKLSPIVKKVLESKNIVDNQEIQNLFKDTNISHDYMLLSDMQKAIDRIKLAIDQNERILVYGDYDADGVTSTTILVSTLRLLGAQVGWYIPNRFTEGYGPNELAFKNAYDEGISLIITVDNGIQGHHEISTIQELGVDVIVTDHHEIGETLPDAFAIVHPMHPNFEYPFKYLCGAGVAYKLAQGLIEHPPQHFIALAAIGTIADLVSLTDENRYIVKQGLKILNNHTPSSIKAILNQAGFNDEITEETIGFIIGPRLNAVGRLEDASLAAELLLSDEFEEAEFLAEQVEHFNHERKDIVSKITDEALLLAEEQIKQGHLFLLLAKEGWHEGVLGIVASKIVETYALPTLILNIDENQNHAKGSARSIEQVSMFDILNDHQQLIDKFGGHHMAAGMTMSIDNIEHLRKELDMWMKELTVTTSLEPSIKVDAQLEEKEINIKNIKDIFQLRPFGTDFNSPLFMVRDLIVKSTKGIGQDNKHLKLTLGHSGLTALFWNHGHLASELEPGQPIHIIGTLQINEWNGNQTPQFIIKDIAIDQLQILDYRSKRKNIQFKESESNVAYVIHPKLKKSNSHYYHYGEAIDRPYDKIVFRDLPNTMVEIEQTLEHSQISQLYLVLQHEKSIYFEGIPSKSLFKKCYKALINKKETDLIKEGMLLCEYLNIKPEILTFMLKVFKELEFIYDEKGLIKINPAPNKQDIENSRIYQMRRARMEVEERLLYDDFLNIKEWIISKLT